MMNWGWTRIAGKDKWICYKDLTQEQLNWMFNHGYETNALAASRL